MRLPKPRAPGLAASISSRTMPGSAQAQSDRTAGSAPSSSGRSRRISGDASSPSTQPHRWRSANGVVPEMMIAVHHKGTEGSNPSPSSGESSNQRQPDGRRRNPDSAGNLVEPDPGGPQTKHFAHLAHRCPLCWHPLPRAKAKGADPNRATRGAAQPSEIISERRATSNRNGGRHHRGFAGDFPRNPQTKRFESQEC